MDFFAPVRSEIREGYPNLDLQLIERAYEFARDAHAGQKRFSGEPYITHPVEVSQLLLAYNPDTEMMMAALLHDVSEDTDKSLADIEQEFGSTVSSLVAGLEKLSKVRARGPGSEIENLRKMFIHFAKDLRIVVIKLVDRLHNMSTLKFVRPDKQERIARETLDIYVPIAARLGIYELKCKLEDLCFEVLEPEQFLETKKMLTSFRKLTLPLMSEIKKALQKEMAMFGFANVKVEARLKSIYSVYQKMKKKGRNSIDEIYDIFAMRVILANEVRDGREYTGHLYAALGVIHSLWPPLPHRFKDYVAVPKPNGYRSLHTTVLGLGPASRHQPTEIQIRTQFMHEEAETGVVSHWVYSQTKGKSALKPDLLKNDSALAKSLNWVTAVNQVLKDTSDNREVISELKSDVFNDRIFVFTPKGDVKDLPFGATPIDFAYAIHSDVGNHAVMAKMNGVVLPLDSALENGAICEILTKESAEPNQFWLSFVKTNSARIKIKNWFRLNADPQKKLKEGRQLVNKLLEQLGREQLDKELSLFKVYDGEKLTFREREELLRDVGCGVLLPQIVIKKLFPEEDLLRSNTRSRSVLTKKVDPAKITDLTKQILVDGVAGLPLKIGTCCLPKLFDPVMGYVTRGRGITVHKKWCKVVSRDLERLINLAWIGEGAKRFYPVDLELKVADRVGLLSEISSLTSALGINIGSVVLTSKVPGEVIFRYQVEVYNYDQLVALMQKLQEVSGVRYLRKL